MRKTYGSVTNYLKSQLEFTQSEEDEEEEGPWKWRAAQGCEERIRKNDWKYSVPNHVE